MVSIEYETDDSTGRLFGHLEEFLTKFMNQIGDG